MSIVTELAKPALEEMGLILWDVRFEKEGANWYLRVFIDKKGGVDINDCENVSRKLDKMLDEADPIDQSYIFEVSSPGIERELVKPWHFSQYIGHRVQVKLIRPVDGVREFTGRLETFADNAITITTDENQAVCFQKKEAAFIKLADEEIELEGIE